MDHLDVAGTDKAVIHRDRILSDPRSKGGPWTSSRGTLHSSLAVGERLTMVHGNDDRNQTRHGPSSGALSPNVEDKIHRTVEIRLGPFVHLWLVSWGPC